MLKFLTINIGLLDYKINGTTLFSNPPYSDKRIEYIPQEILLIDADIVAIQELYYEKHVIYLTNALKHVYPYSGRKSSLKLYNALNMHNGLMILSKYEITDSQLLVHKQTAWIEYFFGEKATLISYIHIPNMGKFAIINTHPTAGGGDPLRENVDAGRLFALKKTLELAQKSYEAGFTPVLIGDFNCGPECSSSNYEFILSNGYRDCYVEAQQANCLQGNFTLYAISFYRFQFNTKQSFSRYVHSYII